ncbi:MAG: TspO/MBR family protein [Lachnospiraceae bacterium]|nr:TspO/MBR family protein [Lachnospiraceae bacterium]
MKSINTKLLCFIAIPLLVGGIAALLTSDSMRTFTSLDKPTLSPPSWLFPVVWTILYTLMGVSAYLIATGSYTPIDRAKALTFYTYQLAVNFLWSIFFFNFEWYFFSFLWIILLWILVLLMIKAFGKTNKTAAYLNIPYLLWITFAAYLNFGIWILN